MLLLQCWRAGSSDPTRISACEENANDAQLGVTEVRSAAKRAHSEHPEQTDKRHCAGRGRPARGCAQRIDYSETKRRGPRKRKVEHSTAYMDASRAMGGKVVLSRAIAVGEVTIERTVGDAYEWRDAAYVKKRRIVFDDGG